MGKKKRRMSKREDSQEYLGIASNCGTYEKQATSLQSRLKKNSRGAEIHISMPKIKPAEVAIVATRKESMSSAITSDSEAENVPPVMIYFGSQSGTAEAFSGIINKEFLIAGIPSKVEDLDKFDPVVFKTHKLVVLVVATTGEGDATDNAQTFNRYMTSKSTSADVLVGLKYAVFGLGDLNYINFNQMGKRTEINMDRLGAHKVYPRGIGDSSQDIEADLRKWIDGGLIEAVRENVPNLTRTGSKPVVVLNSGLPDLLQLVDPVTTTIPATASKGMSTLSKVFWTLDTGSVVTSTELRQETSDEKSTKEISIKLPLEAASAYQACDTVEILPVNACAHIEEIAEYFHISDRLDAMIDFLPKSDAKVRKLPFPTPCTVRHALAHYVDLSCSPSKTLLCNLAVLNRHNPDVEEALLCLADNAALMKEMGSRYLLTWVELLRLIEHYMGDRVLFGLSELLQIAPKQRVRAYTGASVCDNGIVKLVVSLTASDRPSLEPLINGMITAGVLPTGIAVPEFAINRSKFSGVCSSFLLNADASTSLQVRVRESILRPPAQPLTELVAVAAGAGLAPVMAYFDHFEKTDSWPTNVFLVFGCQSSARDFIYKDRLLQLQAEQKVRSWFAFSREGAKRVYVQDVIKETREIHKILHDLTASSRILVCGGTGMGRAVCQSIAAQIGGQSQLEALEQSGRLTVEFFG